MNSLHEMLNETPEADPQHFILYHRGPNTLNVINNMRVQDDHHRA